MKVNSSTLGRSSLPSSLSVYKRPLPSSSLVFSNSSQSKSLKSNPSIRPKTPALLGVKKWRASLFPSGSPASKREVELLGEWLNSVLTENLELHEDPLEVCTNAQHWFSVAFNELLRQVSVSCAERGRLFAVIWKRNQDLLMKLVQIQKSERNYILKCHKDRVQFLKTDLGLCQSSYEKVKDAYSEELERRRTSHEGDVSKFQTQQQKNDEQTEIRKQLVKELNELKEKLGINAKSNNENSDERTFSYQDHVMKSKLFDVFSKLRSNNKPTNSCVVELMDDLSHFLKYSTLMRERDIINSESQIVHTVKTDVRNDKNAIINQGKKIRSDYEEYFLSLPQDAQAEERDLAWLAGVISYICSNYIASIESSGFRTLVDTPFILFIYNTFLGFYGIRECAEQTMLNFLACLAVSRNESSRAMVFSRFIGLSDPFTKEVIPFYMYSLSVFNKERSGPLFPEEYIDDSDPTTSGVKPPTMVHDAERILEKFASGGTFQHYMKYVKNTSEEGLHRFGGKSLAALDPVLSYLSNGYQDECAKNETSFKEQIAKSFESEITYSEFRSFFKFINVELSANEMSQMMYDILQNGKMTPEGVARAVRSYGYLTPIQFVPADFNTAQNPDDISHFVGSELEFWETRLTEALSHAQELDDDVTMKQLRAAKEKVKQVIMGRSLGRSSNKTIREYFERVYTTTLPVV